VVPARRDSGEDSRAHGRPLRPARPITAPRCVPVAGHGVGPDRVIGPGGDRTAEVVGRVRDSMDRYGSIVFATEYARGIADAALDAFDVAFASVEAGPDSHVVRALGPYMLGRAS
jgi:hypothetical protein